MSKGPWKDSPPKYFVQIPIKATLIPFAIIPTIKPMITKINFVNHLVSFTYPRNTPSVIRAIMWFTPLHASPTANTI